MKQKKRRLRMTMKIFLILTMTLGVLSGLSVTAQAKTMPLSVKQEFYEGVYVDFGKQTYIKASGAIYRADGVKRIYAIETATHDETQTQLSFGIGNKFRRAYERRNDSFLVFDKIDKSRTKDTPTGFRVVSGNGTVENPFTFVGIFDTPPAYVSDIKISSSKETVYEGGTVKLTAKILPQKATDRKVKWEVPKGSDNIKLYSDPECRTELKTGKKTKILSVYVKGLRSGDATVRVFSNEDSRIKASCAVTVNEKKRSVPTSSKDPKSFSYIQFRMKDASKNSITVTWDDVPGATHYVVTCKKAWDKYGTEQTVSRSGKKNSCTFKKLSAGETYKLSLKAYSFKELIYTGKTISVVTLGATYGSPVKVISSKNEVRLTPGGTFALDVKAVYSDGSKNKKKINYESTNPGIAAVSSSGKISANKSGTCYIYAYTTNGLYTRIEVIVK